MELPEINQTVRRHRRAWYRPWRCRCGRPYPCPPRLVAEGELVRLQARQACDWYPVYFADQSRPTEGDTP